MFTTLTSTPQSNGRLTLEFWAQSATNRNWAALFSAGNSNAGENRSNGGSTRDYLQFIPRAGAAGNDIRMTTHRANVGAEGFVDNEENVGGFGGDLSLTRDQHLVAVLDQSGALPGTVTLYVDGVNVGTSPIAGGAGNALNLKTFTNINNWIGRSQWPDPVFDGFVNEFRVYDNVLTAAEVNNHWAFGPDVPNPGGNISIQVNKINGQITLVNSATAPLTLEYYRISSVAGALNAGFSGLDGLNYDAVDGLDAGSVAGDSPAEGWDKAGGSDDFELVELVVRETGSVIPGGASLALGQGYDTSVFPPNMDGDLQFEFGLLDGRIITTVPQYVGGLAGNYDGDNDVDGADFLAWQRNYNTLSFTDWKANFGTALAAAAGQAVPEPAGSAMALAAAAMTAWAGARRRRDI
jgi:hypothetical protein